MIPSNQSNRKRNNPSNDESESRSFKSPPLSSLSSQGGKTVELRGIHVHFPFEPYPCQVDYMNTVLDALHQSQNALLESPTGTGKTLSLLCAALAWQRQYNPKHDEILQSSSPEKLTSSQFLQSTENTVSSQCDNNNNNNNNNSKPVILYASRTHSQISQVVQELKRTKYRPKHAVLASREQMCIHPKIKTNTATSSDINNGCSKINKERKCKFRNNLDSFTTSTNSFFDNNKNNNNNTHNLQEQTTQEILDLEDLVSLGNKRKICPFYFTRNHIQNAEIIFIPYNYLFDQDLRNSSSSSSLGSLSQINFQNSVLIFDEAHNLETFASESASFDLSMVDIAGCIQEVSRAIGYYENNEVIMGGDSSNSNNSGSVSLKKDNLIRLKGIFLQLERYLDEGISSPNGGSFCGEFIFEIMAKGANLTHANHVVFLQFVKQVSDYVLEMRGGFSTTGGAASTGTPKLDHFTQCVKRVFGTKTEGQCMARARVYRVHISAQEKKAAVNTSGGGGFVGGGNNANSSGRILSYWCFAPALAMQELASLKVRSIIVTSGTLSPLPSYTLELGIPFQQTLENSHIIGNDQIYVRVVGKGVSGKLLKSSYDRRNDPEYLIELGNTIISLARVIPGGLLLFFPSYQLMENCIEKWGGPISTRSKSMNGSWNKNKQNFFNARKKSSSQSHGTSKYSFPHAPNFATNVGNNQSATIWNRLVAIKAIVLEPKSTADLKDAISEFDKFISMPKSSGCILMGVCRGKISEGIDFNDDKCRAVIITGLPFAPYQDPKVKLKREFLDGSRAASVRSAEEGGFGGSVSHFEGPRNSDSNQNILSGTEWYSQQAHRAVNQAVGRVIRHRNDYGAVLLLDSRFSEPRNQAGLSKWLRPHIVPDEGVGQAIGSVVKFFREAKKKFDSNDTTSKVSKPRLLAYEEEPAVSSSDITNNSDVTKIAFIKRTSTDSNLENVDNNQQKIIDEDAFNGYIDPQRVIKQVELNDDVIKKKMDEKLDTFRASFPTATAPQKSLSSLYANSNKSSSKNVPEPMKIDIKNHRINQEARHDLSDVIKSAWADVKPNPSSTKVESLVKKRPLASSQLGQITKNKPPVANKGAKDFFELAKKTLTVLDFNDAKKLLVSMKSHGDKGDSESYIRSTEALIDILLKYDTTNVNANIANNENNYGVNLIEILYALLPLRYRYKIERKACQKRYENSTFKKSAKSLLSSDKFQTVNKIFPDLMIDYTREYDDNTERCNSPMPRNDAQKQYGVKLQKILQILIEAKDSTIVKLVYPLLPLNQRNFVQHMIHEMKTQDKIKRMKQTEKEKIDNNYQNDKIKSHDEVLPTSTFSLDEESIKAAAPAMMRMKKMKEEMLEQSLKKLEQSREKHLQQSKLDNTMCERPLKKSRDVNIDTGRNHDPIDMCLRQVEGEVYNKEASSVKALNKLIKSNIPNDMKCVICDSNANMPYMSDCFHVACIDCWRSWLGRSKTCPTCRKDASLNSLSRMVFEPEDGAGVPTLTQLCDL